VSLNNLENSLAVIRALWSEPFPNMDISDGSVLSEIVARPAAYTLSVIAEAIENLKINSSLYLMKNFPSKVTEEQLLLLLYNYGMTRLPGNTASGIVTIILSAPTTTSIPIGSQFEGPNNTAYITEASYIGVPSTSLQTSEYDRLIVQRQDGNYAFSIPVIASASGTDHNIKKNSSITPQITPINFVMAYADGDFVGGTNSESLPELFQRQVYWRTAHGLGSKLSIASFILSTTQSKFVSIVGAGDAGMIRDRHNIFKVSGGKADIYVATEYSPSRVSTTKTATLLNPISGIWQLAITKEDFPGYYAIDSILPLGSSLSGSLEIVTETKSIDMTGEDWTPDIDNIIEGAYSKYQTATIQFRDKTTAQGKDAGATEDFSISVYVMPNIDTLQDLFNSTDIREPSADLLIRAPIAIFTSISFGIKTTGLASSVNIAGMKSAIAEAINSRGFTNELPSSVIIGACKPYLNSSDEIQMPIEMMGQVRSPSGQVTIARHTNKLTIPEKAEECMTEKTMLFCIDEDSISISILA
jgi:hypothetical protein